MHSVIWQYLPPETQARISYAMAIAGAAASPVQPLVWLTFFEAGDSLYAMALKIRMWPEGSEEHFANCHPQGTNIDWLV